jgi:hypothetical protein
MTHADQLRTLAATAVLLLGCAGVYGTGTANTVRSQRTIRVQQTRARATGIVCAQHVDGGPTVAAVRQGSDTTGGVAVVLPSSFGSSLRRGCGELIHLAALSPKHFIRTTRSSRAPPTHVPTLH